MKRKYIAKNKREEERSFPVMEMWNLDNTIAAWLVPRLNEFITYYAAFSTPEDLVKQYGEKGNLEWRRILRKMKYAFVHLSEVSYPSAEDGEKIREGLQLFALYFMELKSQPEKET